MATTSKSEGDEMVNASDVPLPNTDSRSSQDGATSDKEQPELEAPGPTAPAKANATASSDTSTEPDTDASSVSTDEDPPEKKPIQNLYEGKRECSCCINWVEKEPPKKEPASGTVITVRRNRDHNREKALTLHSILVHSEGLKDTLRDVLSGTGVMITSSYDFVLERPFQPVFHCWTQMTALNDDASGRTDLEHFKMLYGVLSKELGEFFDEINALLENNSITFDTLWAVFKRGEILITQDATTSERVAVRARSGQYEDDDEPGYCVTCDYIETDGTSFGLTSVGRKVAAFKGAVPIAGLTLCPLRYMPNEEEVRDMLVKRGQRFADLSGYHHKKCKGSEWFQVKDGWRPRRANGRIIIDAETFDENVPDQAVHLRSLSEGEETDGPRSDRSFALVRDSEFLLCGCSVRGYSLKSKTWAKFCVDDVVEIEWNETCASNLILPNGYKDLLLSMVEEQMLAEDGFDDFIEQKGQGFIILLGGETGVGKTLTAEVVAEKMHAPLYSVTAGQLGFGAEELEDNLKLVLDIASKWDAVLLLDEGDVFLEQRTTSDLHRNRLVSIFLQLLEYYTGTLIITTNRTAVIDEAIKSRIHINIRLPSLSEDSRRSLWKNFLTENKIEHELSDGDLDTLAGVNANGREIKNCLKSAILMARKSKEPLSMRQLQVVLEILTASKALQS